VVRSLIAEGAACLAIARTAGVGDYPTTDVLPEVPGGFAGWLWMAERQLRHSA
jgi:hypothetical protein